LVLAGQGRCTTSARVGATPIQAEREPTAIGRLGASTTATRALMSTNDVGLGALVLLLYLRVEILGGGDLADDDGFESAAMTGASAYCPSL
jgi:hypothetical protein